MRTALDPEIEEAVRARLEGWESPRAWSRLLRGDHTLWTAEPQPEITDRLGWLVLPYSMRPHAVAEIDEFAAEISGEGFPHVALLGMGGSSLAPEVFQRVFGNAPGHPELIVLDSTHPGAVAAVEARIDPQRTLFLVSSKSGTTIEPLSFFHYFWDRVSAQIITPGRNFAAITDPGSFLGGLARERRFRRVFETIADVGGRYSALTHFGLVPAALIGIDIARLLDRAAARMPLADDADSGFLLGAALGELALQGRDKVTYLVSDGLEAFPAWLEQLVAESTGKDGKGILPVADEAAGPPGAYGDDRVFVYLALAGDDDTAQAAAVDALEAAGHPVIRMILEDRYDLAGEMYRAEIATALAGSVLGIHPFNQPDVQVAKELARQAMAGELEGGAIPETRAGDTAALSAALVPFLAQARPGDYLAVQAFLAPGPAITARLQEIRHALRDRLGIATTLGYGPRFLHSTGQLHKGGPETGLFLQIVDHPEPDRDVPSKNYSFGRLVAGQADGDYQALAATGRPVLRVCLGDDAPGGLETLAGILCP